MSKRAEIVELVIRSEAGAVLLVDGQEFPWDVLWDGVILDTQTGTLTVSIPADRFVTLLAPDVQSTEEHRTLIGLQFRGNEVANPASNVQVVEEIDCETGLRFLIRLEDDRWGWSTGSESAPVDTGQSWADWMLSFGDKRFRVVKVK